MIANSISKLYEYGYFFCEEAKEIDIVDRSDLEKLSNSDPVVKAAARKYQTVFKEELDRECQWRFRRPVVADGLIGEATGSVLNQPRCGCPDFTDPRQAVLEANHPESCRFDLTYSYNYRELPGTGVNPQEIHDRAIDNWQSLFKFQCVKGQPARGAHRLISLARLGRNVLADQYLANGRCGDTLRGRFDSRRQLSIAMAVAIDAHEFGHFLGLGHETRDRSALMFPSIHQAGIDRGGTPNKSDIRNLVAIGYRLRNETPDPPIDPPVDPPADDVAILREELIGGLQYALSLLTRQR